MPNRIVTVPNKPINHADSWAVVGSYLETIYTLLDEKIMDKQTLLYVLAAWLVLNAIFPLFINSIERLFQGKIDALVKKSLRFVTMLVLGLIQVFLIAFFAPNIFLIAIIERIWPAFFKIKSIEESGVYFAMHTILKKNFWSKLGKNRDSFCH